MHLSLRVYIEYTGSRDGFYWLRDNHTQYKTAYNEQSNRADAVLCEPVILELFLFNSSLP